MNAMRIEKALPRTGDELTIEATPYELGMDWMLDLERNDFCIGQDVLRQMRNAQPRYRLVSIILEETDVDPTGGEPVVQGGDLVGYVSSAAYGHRVGKTVAMGFLRPDLCQSGTEVSVCVLEREISAKILTEPVFDPEGQLARV
jgi:dimethylglycine dehydrogenase